jgi:hypothetical protein
MNFAAALRHLVQCQVVKAALTFALLIHAPGVISCNWAELMAAKNFRQFSDMQYFSNCFPCFDGSSVIFFGMCISVPAILVLVGLMYCTVLLIILLPPLCLILMFFGVLSAVIYCVCGYNVKYFSVWYSGTC